MGAPLEDITTRFYATMLARQPQLLDGLFNRGDQARGTQRQALADSVAAFAAALLADPDARPDAPLARIAHKHAAVGVTEDQYETVHKYLFGDVVLDESDRPIVLVSAGVGCTPMVGLLGHLATTHSSRPVLALHADRSPADHALRADTARLVAELPGARAVFWYERPGVEEPDARTGLMDLQGLELPRDADVYLCGPLPFMRAVRGQLLRSGIPARRIRYEVFGPDLWLAESCADVLTSGDALVR